MLATARRHEYDDTPRDAAAREPGPLRITLVDDDHDLLALLSEVFASQPATVNIVDAFESMTSIADTSPDVILIGLGTRARLAPWQLVGLIRHHRALHDVPVIVCTVDVAADMRGGQLGAYPGVHAVAMPFELDVLEQLVRRVSGLHDALPGTDVQVMMPAYPDSDGGPTSIPDAVADAVAHALADREWLEAARPPMLCPHGYVTDWVERCTVCS